MNQPFSWKVYFIYPNKKVYLARCLTQVEAEELLKILCNADRMYREPQVTFSIKRKDGLIFLSSTKTNTSFVIDYNEGLWQGLRCRMKVNGQVELSKSELTEIYHKRLQTLS
ncbi:MAG: hypothetical protein IGR93_04530 [Hydrococcus sp. C42_A2020_068]|uniref:hypothetical protein n=1 Tax=Pleurocapsa sp. PCC 7327 TaxID=118163 RepID=UPI00029F9408|nr:hypothetical protein [Pleurocapsa sp. PCC 7327]AFY77109.1 hypothetical protein Ple7327_1756 [Pleurocapsa sp. PCC 7327]MBF2019385.1 hypothetical protein [Hydrococcus sp. C42_A2020_068]